MGGGVALLGGFLIESYGLDWVFANTVAEFIFTSEKVLGVGVELASAAGFRKRAEGEQLKAARD